MRGINVFIISFCVSCILLGFLYMLSPEGNMKIPVKYIFCLCFVCCVAGTVIGMPNIDFSAFERNQETQILTEQNTAVTAQVIFCEALRQQNINFRKVTVDTNKLKDNSIVISRVYVYTNESPQRVMDVLDSKNYEVVVINE